MEAGPGLPLDAPSVFIMILLIFQIPFFQSKYNIRWQPLHCTRVPALAR
ncbi:hypothetical protein GY50_0285 [Dehalococcoides mccartyi GY50]|nr:hypothetical protein GY50_0285 [Dehalococcoides mccartyi GY50]